MLSLMRGAVAEYLGAAMRLCEAAAHKPDDAALPVLSVRVLTGGAEVKVTVEVLVSENLEQSLLESVVASMPKWRTLAIRRDMRVASLASLTSYVGGQEMVAPAADSDAPPAEPQAWLFVQQGAAVDKPKDMGGCGFQVELTLSFDDGLPRLLPCLSALMRAAALLKPCMHMQLVTSAAAGAHTPHGETDTVVLRIAASQAEPMAFYRALHPALADGVLAADGAVRYCSKVCDADVSATVLRGCAAPPAAEDAGVARLHVGDAEASCPLFLFVNCVLQDEPSTGVLAALRAKTTAASWLAYGLRLTGGALADVEDLSVDTQWAGHLIQLRFAAAHDDLPPPIVMALSIRHRMGASLLGPKIEARLVKAALSRALHALKEDSGGRLASAAERDLRAHGLPAVARAVARIARASSLASGIAPLVEALLAARLEDACEPPPVDAASEDELDPAAQMARLQELETALLSALTSSLDVSCAPREATWRAEPRARAPSRRLASRPSESAARESPDEACCSDDGVLPEQAEEEEYYGGGLALEAGKAPVGRAHLPEREGDDDDAMSILGDETDADVDADAPAAGDFADDYDADHDDEFLRSLIEPLSASTDDERRTERLLNASAQLLPPPARAAATARVPAGQPSLPAQHSPTSSGDDGWFL